MTRRTERLNSLLKQVIAQTIHREVKNPTLSTLITVTSVDVTKDMHNAKVFISVIGTEEEKKKALTVLRSASGFISATSSKKVRLRFFPALTFHLDNSVDAYMRVEELLQKIDTTQTSND